MHTPQRTPHQPAAVAMVTLAKCLAEGKTRREAISLCREHLVQHCAMRRESAELLAWQTIADMEHCRETVGHFIDTNESTANLLVIRTPQQKLVFTLRDLVRVHEHHRESAAEADLVKPTLH